MKSMPRTATFLDSFKFHLDSLGTYPSERSEKRAALLSHKAKLGTVLGVFLPTIQHIMGLLMFIRHSWIVGHCGLIECLLMVSLCCLTTFFTVISVSAITTNGILQAGGSYYVLSRNLGPECGGSIGICFYLANTFATCLYLLGSIELFLVYMVPQWAIFGDIHHDPWNNYRIYGTCLLFLLTVVVALGVKIVQLFAPISLLCVIISILSIVVGAFMSHPNYRDTKVCLLGEKLYINPLSKSHGHSNFSDDWCSKNETSFLHHNWCSTENGTTTCDPYFLNSEVHFIPAIPGLTSGIIKDNLYSHYLNEGDVARGIPGQKSKGEVTSDMTTNFIILCAIYFPSVTGILTGVNMSGDLRNPQKSIPKGTILAQLTCSFVYLLLVLLYGATIQGEVLRDKFGESLGGELVSALLCWPNKWVVLVGAFSSSLGAGLQCLVSAPRLLQAIARDDIIPFLSFFKTLTKRGEPFRALVLTFFIAEIGMIIANIDAVAPIIDVFFLMCYLFVNLICVLQTILKLPNWRPRFKYYHWTLSLAGVFLNFALCIIAGWYYALSAFMVAAFIFVYIQYKGGEKEWGDGMSGLLMSFTERALLSLTDETHLKNWRPQILVLDTFNLNTNKSSNPDMLSFISQLKHSRGFSLLGSVIVGDPLTTIQDVEKTKELLVDEMAEYKIKGFVKVVTSSNLKDGLSIMIQCLGLGCMTHNTIMLPWPTLENEDAYHTFINIAKLVREKHLALLVLKSTDFPDRLDKLSGTIDIWWIIHDGGMLILLSFLLKQHKVWKRCKIRIFTVAHVGDNSVHIKQQLESYLYEIRIEAEVFVEEMVNSDISAYEVERTLDMESRVDLMKRAAEKKFPSYVSAFQMLRHVESGKSFERHQRQKEKSPRGDSPPMTKRSDMTYMNREYSVGEGLVMKDLSSDNESTSKSPIPVHFTFSAKDAQKLLAPKESIDASQILRMHNAMELNKVLNVKSSDAELIIMNLPPPPSKHDSTENYMAYMQALSNNLRRILFVRGSGKEVVSAYS